jgi:tRNA-2-methylthio-N6-dimethylallyladenosine synthase
MNEKKFYIETFGCQMNHHDSEKVAGSLINMGYVPAVSPSEADLLLLNTCNIREKANQKVFSRLGSVRKTYGTKPETRVGVLGCMAQMEGKKIFERAPNVNLVVGSSSYSFLPALVRQVEQGNSQVIDVSQDTDRLFEVYTQSRESLYKAYVTIMEGCNRFCSFCVVPYTRGSERSRPGSSIVREIERLVSEGYQEVMLLGQTVNSWKDPLGEIPSFAELLLRVAEIPGIRRIRFTSPHPGDFGPDLVRAIESAPQICNQVHLPLQSGSNAVLKRMKRDYTRDEYLEKVDMLKQSIRGIAVSTDVIVGFPGESQEDFEATLSLLEIVRYDWIFSFKYSPRPGTEAFTYQDPISEEEKGRRLAILQEFQKKVQLQKHTSLVGKVFEVLVEGNSQRDRLELMGRTHQNKIINFPGPKDLLGKFVLIRVRGFSANCLVGELADCC